MYVNLQNCGYLVNYDMPWQFEIYNQRCGRIKRDGSTFKNVKVFNLLMKEGIDPSVWEAVQNKQAVFNFLVENSEEQSEAIKKAMYRKAQ